MDGPTFKDSGTFVAPDGASFPSRALPEATLGKPYNHYEVVKPIPGVKEGPAIPWFGQPGKGMQYELPPGGIDQLIKDGFIVKVDGPGGGGVVPKVDTPGSGSGVTPKVETDAPKVDDVDENTRGMGQAFEREKSYYDIDGNQINAKFEDLSPDLRDMALNLKTGQSIYVDKISPKDLGDMTKWLGNEIGVFQSIHSAKLRLVMGDAVSVGGLRPGETFVVHTHPVVISHPRHFIRYDLPAMRNAGEKVEGVVDAKGMLIFFKKTGILNPRNAYGNILPMKSDFNGGFVDADGFIVGYGKIQWEETAEGVIKLKVK
jgi:hypothetical protein